MAGDPSAKTEAEQVEFFERCHDHFLHARKSVGDVRHFFRVGGRIVCLTFAGTSLVPHLTAALEHLRVPDTNEPVDLTLCIWDSLSTATAMIPAPCRPEDLTVRGEIWGMDSHRIKTALRWYDGSVSLLDHATRTGLFWVSQAAALPYWERSAPLRTLLHWWMERNGCQLLHAAGVGADGGAVLLAGRGGVGKSTAALSCLRSGLPYLADDYLVVRLEPEPTAYSLYCTAKLNADHLVNFPEFHTFARNSGKPELEKAVIYLYPTFAHQIVTEMPLRAILAPRIAGGDETTLRAASSWDIQRAISFETISQLPHVGGHTHDTICRLASTLPGYTLEMGRDLHKIPTAIVGLLTERSQQEAGARAAARAAEHPLVSVIIPVLNGERVIADAVHNVLRQHYPALEVIVVDRGSTDRTEGIVSQLPSDIRYYKQEHADPASARNRGIRDAAGEIIAFADVDDPWPDNHVTSMVLELLRDPELEVVHAYDHLTARDDRGGEERRLGNLKDAFQFFGGAVYRKSVFARIGLFDATLSFGEAYEWFGRATESGVKMRRIEDATRPGGSRGLNTLRAFKTALDRRRAIEAQTRESE